MIGLLKLAVCVGVAYTVGGSMGVAGWRAINKDASPESAEGAAWAGRAVTLVVLTVVANRIG